MRLAFWRRPKPPDRTVGAILLETGVITREELMEAVETKMRSSGEQLLGEVLIAKGFVTRRQLDRALDEQRRARGTTAPEYLARSGSLAARSTAGLGRIGGQLDELEARLRELAGEPPEEKKH